MRHDYMIQCRKKTGLSLDEMARYLKISPKLLRLLEEDDSTVTHPKIARRIKETYHLTAAQYLGLIPANYRPGPGYDPGKYVLEVEKFEAFPIIPRRDLKQ